MRTNQPLPEKKYLTPDDYIALLGTRPTTALRSDYLSYWRGSVEDLANPITETYQTNEEIKEFFAKYKFKVIDSD